MKIFHRIVLSVFTVTTFGKVGVHANNNKCDWDNQDHNHGEWFAGPTLTCYCDNGRWDPCRDNGAVQSSSSQVYHGNHAASSSSSSSSSSDDSEKDCKYLHYTTNHGDSLRGDTQTCDCVNGKWRNCSTHSYDDKRCERDGNKYAFQEWHPFGHEECYCTHDHVWERCKDLNPSVKCHHNSREYTVGDWRDNQNERCTCRNNGNWRCEDNKKCSRNGNTYALGQSHDINGERCFCNWNGDLENCEELKCERNNNRYQVDNWHDFNNERCYCDWNGEWLRDCESHQCEHNNNKYDTNRRHDLNDESCLCDGNGEWKDCRSYECERNNNKYDVNLWHDLNGESCLCDWNGEWKDCERHYSSSSSSSSSEEENDHCESDGTTYSTGGWHDTREHGYCKCEHGNVWNCNDNTNHNNSNDCWSDIFEKKEYAIGEWYDHDGETCVCAIESNNWYWSCGNNNSNNCWSDDLNREYSNGEWYVHGGETCVCEIENNNWSWSCEWSSSSSNHNNHNGNTHNDEWQCETIAEFACNNNNNDFSILCAALHRLNLFDTLHNTEGQSTLFAPTNRAFEKYLDGDNINDINSYDLRDVLLTNVVDRVLYKEELLDRCEQLLQMVSGKNTRTLCTHTDGYQLYQKGGGNLEHNVPKLINTDIEVCNGIVHVVDEVILP